MSVPRFEQGLAAEHPLAQKHPLRRRRLPGRQRLDGVGDRADPMLEQLMAQPADEIRDGRLKLWIVRRQLRQRPPPPPQTEQKEAAARYDEKGPEHRPQRHRSPERPLQREQAPTRLPFIQARAEREVGLGFMVRHSASATAASLVPGSTAGTAGSSRWRGW